MLLLLGVVTAAMMVVVIVPISGKCLPRIMLGTTYSSQGPAEAGTMTIDLTETRKLGAGEVNLSAGSQLRRDRA